VGQKEYHEKNRCEHNKQKYFCLICDGGAYCEHKIQRAMCPTCGGTSLCEHGCKKLECKKCNNPVTITIKHMLTASKQTDKLKNRYNKDEFVDNLFLQKLIKESNNICCYCAETLNYEKRNARLATIERIDNSIGHTKNNVKIACFTCNVSRVGNITPTMTLLPEDTEQSDI
jgi:hypothetical protein